MGSSSLRAHSGPRSNRCGAPAQSPRAGHVRTSAKDEERVPSWRVNAVDLVKPSSALMRESVPEDTINPSLHDRYSCLRDELKRQRVAQQAMHAAKVVESTLAGMKHNS